MYLSENYSYHAHKTFSGGPYAKDTQTFMWQLVPFAANQHRTKAKLSVFRCITRRSHEHAIAQK
jgi:hypothetical protein